MGSSRKCVCGLLNVAVGALLVLGAPPAFAGSITNLGIVYTLSSSLVGHTKTTQVYDVTLTANTSGYKGPSNTNLLDAVAIKVDSDRNVLGESLLSGPTGWTFVDGGTGGTGVGCVMSKSDMDCAQGGSVSSDLGVDSKSGSQPDTWVFQITVKSGTLSTTGDIRAQYVNSTGSKQVALSSVSTTNSDPPATPEPASLALLGTALLGAYGLLRRKLKEV